MARQLHRRLTPVPLKNVRFAESSFWGSRIRTNRSVTLPIQYRQCKLTGRLDAFRLDWKPGKPNQPHHFWDSDIAKWIEAAAYSLAMHPDRKLEKLVDGAIDLIASAQQPDGYLNVYYSAVAPGKRWTNLRDMHELYCAGHLIEAAVAYYEATGKRRLLDVMCRYADHIASVFGPMRGQKRGYCGHPEIELALMRLHDATGEDKHRELARFFVDERGRPRPHYYDVEARERSDTKPRRQYDYYQAHAPVREQRDIDGHAVRALYLLSGMIDVAADTGDSGLFAACKRLWRSAVQRRMYITGGVGSKRQGERFTYDYDLPNETAYAETCANIALCFAAHRMLQVEPDSQYADVMERALYNAVISGVSLGGDRFFYANPLAVHTEAFRPETEAYVSGRRQEWFGCACCPPNLARLLGSLGRYVYSTSPDAVYFHLYAPGSAALEVAGRQIKIEQKTNYPWSGDVKLIVRAPRPVQLTLALRLPGWCDTPSAKVNGKALSLAGKVERGYARIAREWRNGDRIDLSLPMPIRLMRTNPRCRQNVGRVAIQRGPIVYCAEEADVGADIHALRLPADAKLTARHVPGLLGGVTVIRGRAQRADPHGWNGELYRARPVRWRSVRFQAVPYCVWGNRREGQMQVWIGTCCDTDSAQSAR